jgi:hypothetical protein
VPGAFAPPGSPFSLPLWPLPLVAGLMPAVASLLALWLSSQAGFVPGCNPFVEGCTSISRAARHGLGNHFFRAIVLPAAALQMVVWVLVAMWLRSHGQRAWRALLVIAFVAPAALILYGSFLGTEGTLHRLLRQYGTVLYFGLTCVAMLLTGRALARLSQAGTLPLPPLLERSLTSLFVVLVGLGVFNAFAGWLFDEITKDRVQNISEWWGSLVLTAVFVVLALVWRRQRLRVQVAAG